MSKTRLHSAYVNLIITLSNVVVELFLFLSISKTGHANFSISDLLKQSVLDYLGVFLLLIQILTIITHSFVIPFFI